MAQRAPWKMELWTQGNITDSEIAYVNPTKGYGRRSQREWRQNSILRTAPIRMNPTTWEEGTLQAFDNYEAFVTMYGNMDAARVYDFACSGPFKGECVCFWVPSNMGNHSRNANIAARRDGDLVHLVEQRDIAIGDELTVDYRTWKFPDWFIEWCRTTLKRPPINEVANTWIS